MEYLQPERCIKDLENTTELEEVGWLLSFLHAANSRKENQWKWSSSLIFVPKLRCDPGVWVPSSAASAGAPCCEMGALYFKWFQNKKAHLSHN